MNEMYWLTRLDSLHTCMQFFLGFSILALIVFTMIYLSNKDGASNPDIANREYYKEWTKLSSGWIKGLIPATIILSLGLSLIPTTKEAFLIYGVGGTIDYIKSDSIATQLPHKVIVALDKYLDEQTE